MYSNIGNEYVAGVRHALPHDELASGLWDQLDTIPSPTSYLPRLAESRLQAWEERLGRHDRLRVGLVWSGNPKHGNDHNRSLLLRALAPIFDIDATFVSLQKDPRPADKATLLERTDIVDLTAHLTDFTETAALIACLDLVITVDTSVAISPPLLDVRPGFCCPTRQIIVGCSIATTALGIQARVCSARPKPATTAKCSNGYETRCSRLLLPNKPAADNAARGRRDFLSPRNQLKTIDKTSNSRSILFTRSVGSPSTRLTIACKMPIAAAAMSGVNDHPARASLL